jgi:aspartate/methionine/tyrosine aminotransferase
MIQLASIMGFLAEKTNIPGSVTIQLLDRVKELKRAGYDVISLSAGEPDFVKPDHIRIYLPISMQDTSGAENDHGCGIHTSHT